MRPWRTSRPLGLVAVLALSLLGLAASPAQAAFSTSARETWSANNTVYAIAVHGNRVYIGGHFTSVKNVATGQVVMRSRLAAFDANTGALITSFHPSVASGEVRAIDVSADGSTVYIGGTFSGVNGTGRSNIAAVDTNGDLVPGWNVTASGTVKDVARVGGDLYLAGTFGNINGAGRSGLAKVAAANGQLSSWRVPTSGGKPRAIFPSPNGSDLIIAGSFTSLNGQPRPFLGSAALSNGNVTPWAPAAACSDCAVFDVVADGTGVYGAIGGSGGRAVKWSATTGKVAWSLKGDGNAQAVALAGGTLYVGGHFGPTFAGQPRGQIAAITVATGKLLPWAPNLGTSYFPGVWAIAAGPDFLRVGGGFRSVNGSLQARYAEFPFV